MKLYVLYAGDIICRDLSQLNAGSTDTGEIALANPIFLIHHPKGWVLWDAGLSDELIHQKGGVDSWIFHLSMKKTVLSQLSEIGIDPNDIDYFAFSHVHNDHTGNANYFKSARLIIQEKEYDTAFNTEKKPSNYSDYEELKHSEVLKLNGDFDLFGDGKVQFIATPGHTAGHQSMLLKLENTGTIIISGDIAYYQQNYEERGIPTFNSSKEESITSIQKIEGLRKREQAQLWIQHDKTHFNTLKLSPNYYD